MISLSRYKAGEIIIQENDLGETAYVIAQGQVEVSKERDGQNAHLAYLAAGETFGEMSMIDEKPRSATVTAVTETLVSEIRRDNFFNSFQTDPKVALQLLKVLFERLREADAMILALQKADPQHALVPKEVFPVVRAWREPLSRWKGSLCRYKSLGTILPLSHEARVGVVDRGSTLGSWVDDRQVGGPSNLAGPVFFSRQEALLILGHRDSPFRYRVTLGAEVS